APRQPVVAEAGAGRGRKGSESSLDDAREPRGNGKVDAAQAGILHGSPESGAPQDRAQLGDRVLLQMEAAGRALEVLRDVVRSGEPIRRDAHIGATRRERLVNVREQLARLA